MIRRALCLSFCLMALALCARAQCPVLKMTAPDGVKEGEAITVSVEVTGGTRGASRTFDWEVSAGKISRGQGTPSIKIDTTGVTGMTTATVLVGGYMRQCPTAKSTTVFLQRPVFARKFDEYGPIPSGEEKARLDNFAIELMNDPTAKAYVVTYGSPRNSAASAGARIRMVETYLVDMRGVSPDRLVIVKGANRPRPFTELWIVPNGAKPPGVSPAATASKRAPARKRSTPK